ncbi:hypothetical protein MBLNU230_g5627t1 [Neophaeotheca triangularis]
MLHLDNAFSYLGSAIEDASEETFDLFSNPPISQDLGMLDPKAPSLDLTISNRDFTIKQSPGSLQSNRGSGTTASAVWQSSLRAAEWLAKPDNLLYREGILKSSSTVLELGSGISALVPCVLAPKVAAYLATDQLYALKLLQENLDANLKTTSKPQKASRTSTARAQAVAPNVQTAPLDWETTDAPSVLRAQGFPTSVDVVLSCDSIYNYALVEPFTQTCADICGMREVADGEGPVEATVCVIVQQLRQPDVFELWLETFMRRFRVWRVPDSELTEGLGEGSGFVVHVAVLKRDAAR